MLLHDHPVNIAREARGCLPVTGVWFWGGGTADAIGALPRISAMTAREVMTANPVAIPQSTMAVEALAMMEQRKITSIVVIDADRRVEGVVHLHDLWRTEMV